MSMSLLDVVPLSEGARKSLQERSVEPQRGTVSVESEAVTEAGGAPRLPKREPQGVVSRSLAVTAAVPGLPAAVLSTAAASLGEPAGEVLSSGFGALDQLLPARGIRRGSLLEWLPAGVEERSGQSGWLRQTGSECKASDGGSLGSGAVTLALAMAVQVARASVGDEATGDNVQWSVSRGRRGRRGQRRGVMEQPVAGAVLVVDRSGWFYPPAVIPWLNGRGGGAAFVQLVVARPSRDDDEIWAIDQALRCGGVAAVVACPSASVACSNVMRRWQLAARTSGAVGLFVRPWQCRRDPSWAEARLVVTPLQRPRCPAERGCAEPLPGPPVAPRSEAVLRRWRIERLSSLLYGEGRSCEVLLDLERGVEPPQAVRRQMASLQSALPPLLPLSAGSQQLTRQRSGLDQQSVEQRRCDDVLPLRVSEGPDQQPAEVARAGEIYRKDGVACRAS